MDYHYIRKVFSKIPGLSELSRRAQRRKRAWSYYQPIAKRINNWARKKTESSNFYYDLTENNKAHLAALISVVTKTPISVIEKLFKELNDDISLRNHIEISWKNNSQMNDAKVAYARRIGWYVLTRILKPKIIIETGVHQGVGACVLTSALIKNSFEGSIGKYIGIDINQHLESGYQEMREFLNSTNCKTEIQLFFKDALQIDYTQLDYDMVFTSPPYFFLEKYSFNAIYDTKEEMKNKFYIPLLKKTLDSLKMGGYYCLNINKEIYEEVAVPIFGKALEEIPLKKSKRQNDYKEFIYVWRKI